MLRPISRNASLAIAKVRRTGLGLSMSYDIVVKTARRQDRRRYRAGRLYRIHYYAAADTGGAGKYWRPALSVYILIVDDEPDVETLFRQQFRRDLRAGRFHMDFAPSAPAALERAVDVGDPSLVLILSDVNMPA